MTVLAITTDNSMMHDEAGLKKKKKKTMSKKDDEQQQVLCPICDDACTCSSTAQSTPVANSQNRLRHHKTKDKTRKAGAYIWDFNIRGQLIPLEDPGNSEGWATDAECSDLVSASDMTGDGLSDTLSSTDDEDCEDSTAIIDDDDLEALMCTASLSQEVFCPTQSDNGNRIAAITPQILAAISNAAKSAAVPVSSASASVVHSNARTISVLLMSTSDESSVDCFDVSVIRSFSSDDDHLLVEREVSSDEDSNSGEDMACDHSTVGGEDLALDPRSMEPTKRTKRVKLGHHLSQKTNSSAIDRFKRIPVNAFYRRSRAQRAPASHYLPPAAHALRPTSVDPTFIVTPLPGDPSMSSDGGDSTTGQMSSRHPGHADIPASWPSSSAASVIDGSNANEAAPFGCWYTMVDGTAILL